MAYAVAEEHIPGLSLGRRLRLAREDARIEQAEMAEQIGGVSRPLVSKWERDLAEPRPSQLRRWAQITGVPMWWLLDIAPRSGDPGEASFPDSSVQPTLSLFLTSASDALVPVPSG